MLRFLIQLIYYKREINCSWCQNSSSDLCHPVILNLSHKMSNIKLRPRRLHMNNSDMFVNCADCTPCKNTLVLTTQLFHLKYPE